MRVKEILDYKLVVRINRDEITFILKYKIKNKQIYDKYIRNNYDEKTKINGKTITIGSATFPEIGTNYIYLPGCESSCDEMETTHYFFLIDYELPYLLFIFGELCKAMETFMNKDIDKLILKNR